MQRRRARTWRGTRAADKLGEVCARSRAVATALKTVTADTMDELVARAAASQRRRTNLNLHEAPGDPINRFLNVGVAGTYVRPHRHAVGRWEMFVALRGRLDVVTFAADGIVAERLALTPD